MSNKRSGDEISYQEQLANAGGGKRCKQQASSLLADVRKVGKKELGREKGGGSFALLTRPKSPFPFKRLTHVLVGDVTSSNNVCVEGYSSRKLGHLAQSPRLGTNLDIVQNSGKLPWRPDDENHLPPVFEKVDINAIPGINLYPVDSTISFRCTYLPDRDLWSFIRWIVACVAGGIGSECCCFLAAELRTPATAI